MTGDSTIGYALFPPQHCPPIGQHLIQPGITSTTRTTSSKTKKKETHPPLLQSPYPPGQDCLLADLINNPRMTLVSSTASSVRKGFPICGCNVELEFPSDARISGGAKGGRSSAATTRTPAATKIEARRNNSIKYYAFERVLTALRALEESNSWEMRTLKSHSTPRDIGRIPRSESTRTPSAA